MKVRDCLIILFSLLSSYVYGQTISISSFKEMTDDVTAVSRSTTVLNQNGEKYALIKIETIQTRFSFDVDMLGSVKTVYNPGEIWVYAPTWSKTHFYKSAYIWRLISLMQ